MPTLRALLSLSLLLALLLTPATATGHASGVTDPVLPLLVEGGAPAAALLARDSDRTRYAPAGRGIARADHFRAGSVTKSCVATVVLQLADEHRLSLSDTVERYLPGLLRGPGTDGRRITLSALLTHTSGLADFTRATCGAVPLTPFQAVRIALTLPPARPGHYSCSNTGYVLLGIVVVLPSSSASTRRRSPTPASNRACSLPGSVPAPGGTDGTRPEIPAAATRSSDIRRGRPVSTKPGVPAVPAGTSPQPSPQRRHSRRRSPHRGATPALTEAARCPARPAGPRRPSGRPAGAGTHAPPRPASRSAPPRARSGPCPSRGRAPSARRPRGHCGCPGRRSRWRCGCGG
ncbi:beta-lactamase [Streptomyces collinus Tu 365]|uniref:Beta-lactamase n=1 Tax=Streptomyces collinus (strain DSM 40733 / Tue 365) TaxID=1214242 RepID=S5UVR5_STRC3|nr:beta-lactamase [Streptomyces collinus Tu 365]